MTGRIVILAHDDDADAALLLKALQQAQPDLKACVVRPESLALARWCHEVDAKGHARTRIRLPNRMELSDESVGCVLNRLRYIAHPGFARTAQRDRDYANTELQALVCSWLAGLGRKVINPVLPYGVPAAISARRWLCAANELGLPVARNIIATSGMLIGTLQSGERLSPRLHWPGSTDLSCGPVPTELMIHSQGVESFILVAGSTVRGELASQFGEACLALARQAQHRLLELQFVYIDAHAKLVRVESIPRLRNPDVVARLLSQVALGRGDTG